MDARRAATGNALLRRLPTAEAARIGPFLENVPLVAGTMPCEVGATILHAVFPDAGAIALLGIGGDGSVLEIGLVGHEGMFGVPLVFNVSTSPVRAIVQAGGNAVRIEASRFRRLLEDCPSLKLRAHDYAYQLGTQFAQTAVCNCFHSTESRSARWMLAMSDRMESDAFTLTQSVMAVMLGVLRPAANRAALQLSGRGLVSYSRGYVRILDRAGLEAAACECYPIFAARAVRNEMTVAHESAVLRR